MLDLPCAPTLTSRDRCRKVQPKRWAISWRRSCEKGKEKTQSVGENDTIILSDALWTFRRVGHGVGQENSPPEKPNKLKRKPAKISRFSPVSGASGRTWTGDLLITNSRKAIKQRFLDVFSTFCSEINALCVSYFHCFRPLLSPCGSVCGSNQKTQRKNCAAVIKDEIHLSDEHKLSELEV